MYTPKITGYATLAEVRIVLTQAAGIFPVAGTAACLPRRMLLDTTDRDEVTAVIGELLCEHELLVEGPAAQFRAQVRDCAVGDLRLAHFKYGTAFTVKSQPLGRYVVNFTISGVSRVRHGRASAVAGSGQGTVFSPRADSELTFTPETEVLSLVVPKAALEEHFRRLSGIGSGEIVFDPQIGADTAQLLRSLIGAALRVSGGGLFDMPEAVSWQMRDAILTAMLLELRHDHWELLTSLRGSEAKRLCDAATSVMRRQLASPASIPKIAAELGVSERSLQVTFRHELDTTPSARFKQLRLEAVYDALLRLRPEDSTVTQVASDVGGFFHLGRFAREYLAMFGEHPSATLHRQASR
jgi:AraC-like DNA-binding protein